MSYVARALEMDEARGLHEGAGGPRIRTDCWAPRCSGIEGGELMAALQLAMMGQAAV